MFEKMFYDCVKITSKYQKSKVYRWKGKFHIGNL